MNRKLASSKPRDSDFHTADLLGAEIEAVYGAGGMTWIEACVEVAEAKNIEIEVLGKMVPKTIKDKLLAEASSKRLLKPQHRITTLL